VRPSPDIRAPKRADLMRSAEQATMANVRNDATRGAGGRSPQPRRADQPAIVVRLPPTRLQRATANRRATNLHQATHLPPFTVQRAPRFTATVRAT